MEVEAFYVTVAGAGAAIFGVGGAILATRVVALAERANNLRREAGELLNARVFAPEHDRLRLEWEERSKRDALADLHSLSANVRTALAVQLGLATGLVLLCTSALAGFLPDNSLLRALCLFALTLSFGGWIVVLWRLVSDLMRVTHAAKMLRDRQIAEASKTSDAFLVTGNPEHLVDAQLRVLEPLSERLPAEPWVKYMCRRARLRLWQRRIRRGREPLV